MPFVTELNIYPVKSCGGIALREAVVTGAGLMSGEVRDREWMVVDLKGGFLTQRSHPAMALIRPRIASDALELHAPGMPALDIPLARHGTVDTSTMKVGLWDDTLEAEDCGDAAAAWLSGFLGTQCRLTRFHPGAKRFADRNWTGGQEVPALFSDGFPMLLISEASLADLNGKLIAHGRETLQMNRFRPNVVIGGIEAFEEDYIASLAVGGATIRPVKPCPRCPIPSVDQATGRIGPDPLDILRAYRADPLVGGGITFGMNAILAAGEGRVLRVGCEAEADFAF
jgi:uncharacterized protein YcbX